MRQKEIIRISNKKPRINRGFLFTINYKKIDIQ